MSRIKNFQFPQFFGNQSNLGKKRLSIKVARKGSCFFDAFYLGVKIFRLELANHDQILPQSNDNIKGSFVCRFLKKEI